MSNRMADKQTRQEAERFLSALDPEAERWTFQTFDDDKERKDKKLARIFHGTLAQHWSALQKLNAEGAGIFITVNETDLRGRTENNIVKVRALFVDLDGAPLDPVTASSPAPHIVVETSPLRWHAYWLVSNVAREAFSPLQRALIARFGGDPSVHDLPRVMRLPGFIHRKGEPFHARVHAINAGALLAADHDFVKALQPERNPGAETNAQREGSGSGTHGPWQEVNTAALAHLDAWVPKIFPTATLQASGAYRVTAADLGRKLQEDLSLSPKGIKDFGIADQGDPNKGKRTAIEIVQDHTPHKHWRAAMAWLQVQLGLAGENEGLTPEQAAEIARLAALPPIQYDQARAAAADKLGIRVGTLDELVAKNRPYVADDTAQGTALNIAVTEPWPGPVNGDELMAEIEQSIKKHVVLTDDQALACTLWTVHTHLHSISEHSPRLNIASPAPECGKSTLLKTISRIVAKPLVVENISTAALFRVVEMVVPTLLIDEVDTFLKENDEMRGLLNAGHERNGQVIRVVGENLEPRTFKVGCATVLAGIGELPPTLESRSITIALRRRLRKETISRLRSNRTKHLEVLGRKAARWAADHQIALGAADPALPEGLNDRAQDNWRQLIAIADLCSDTLGKRARAAAVAVTAENADEDNSASTMALTDVAAIFQARGTPAALASADIVDALILMDDRPWRSWRRGEVLTQNSLARLLKPFHIRPTQVKSLNKKGYEAAPIIDAKARYVDRADAQGTLPLDDL